MILLRMLQRSSRLPWHCTLLDISKCNPESNLGHIATPLTIMHNFKHTINYSKVPKLNEDDLEEQFVRGHGPGGSNVNKTSNCVVLIHKPTGRVIKCHQSRLLDKNRKIARQLMIEKLDQDFNGEDSVMSQSKLNLEKKSTEKERKRKKLELLKTAWKEREGV